MIRKLLNGDIDRVADIWLKTNLKAHYFISNQYWKSNYELVKEMLSQSEVYVFEADKMIQGFVGLNDKYIGECEATVQIYVGEKEKQSMKKSAKIIHEKLQDSFIQVLPNMNHGEFSINHADDYVRKLLEIVKRR